MAGTEREPLSLDAVLTHILEECRMVLPGMQALFGFQLIAVFNSTFHERLTDQERLVHLISITLICVAIALVMAPAAYHRQTYPEEATKDVIVSATRLLLWSMFPLLLGICLDFYLIANLILRNQYLSLFLSGIVCAVFVTVWFFLPRSKVLRKLISKSNG
jgi:Family of unknown function (DUF6328)